MFLLFSAALLLAATTSPGQEGGRRTAEEAAEAFTLDGLAEPAAEPTTSEAAPTSEPAAAAPLAEAPATPPAAVFVPASPRTLPGAGFSLDTPIGALIADAGARAVLDRHLPGLSTDENLDKFRALSLRRFQPLTGGQLTDALLAETGADLAALPPRRPGRRAVEGR